MAGPEGTSGISGWELLVEDGPSSSSASHGAMLSCPSGKRPIGGGARVQGSFVGVALTENRPAQFGPDYGWSAKGEEMVPQSGSWFVQVLVICANVAE